MKKLIYPVLIAALLNMNLKAQTSSESTSNVKGIIGGAVLVGIITAFVVKSKIDKKKKKKIAEQNTLNGKKVKALQISHSEENITHTQGSLFKMIIKAQLDNGQELITEGAGNGLTPWDNYIITADGGKFENGLLTINDDLKTIKNRKVILKASVKSDPSVTSEFEIPILFDGNLHANYNGYCGSRGKSGRDGGAMKSPGDGEKGNDGDDGMDGLDGGDGSEIDVFVKAIKDGALNKDLLYVRVKSLTSGNESMYIVDPSKAKITISSNGGCGGTGGTGGHGGPGGGSGDNNRGNGGNGGKGGAGGNGGNGGIVKIYTDPSAKNYSAAILVTNYGGNGGSYGNGGGVGTGKNQGKYGQNGSRSGRAGRNGQAPVFETKEITLDINQ